MIRIIGCLLIFTGCTAMGFFKSVSYKARTDELQNVIEMLKLMHMEILYKKEPLVKTFRHVAAVKNCWFSKVLQSCSQRLAEHCPLHDAWNKALENGKRECPLHEKDIAVLEDMIPGLGKSDAEGQQKVLESAVIRLQGCLDNAEDQEQKQGRMYCSLGAAAGVVAAIILI